jgi:hypothetical protein
MPIQLALIPTNALFSGYIWKLKDENQLARLVALILLGRYLHVEKILDKLKPKGLSVQKKAREEAKSNS